MRGHRGHVHDVAGHPAPLHVLDRLARRDREPEHVHLEHLAPELGRRRGERRAPPEAGGVHEHVDAAEAVARQREQTDHVGLAAHVGGRDGDRGATAAELGGERLEPVHPPRAEDDSGARLGERARRGRADAARRARDHHRSADECAGHARLVSPLDLPRQSV